MVVDVVRKHVQKVSDWDRKCWILERPVTLLMLGERWDRWTP